MIHPLKVGPYLLEERLGAGGMAEVYVARKLGAPPSAPRVAIKRILPQLARDPRFVAMFCDEARICTVLDHPNIVRVIDFGEDQAELFMAMEYIEGPSCARLLRTVAAKGIRFPPTIALTIFQGILSALAYAHEALDAEGRPLGIVHRDVSPGNILISLDGRVMLTDFGIVRSDFVARRTYPGELKGKIGYMSPEQVVGAEVDPRSDLFTLAIVLAEMLLTRPLFPGRSEMEILTRIYEADIRVLEHHGGGLSPHLLSLLRHALARRAIDRPASARELSNEVTDYLAVSGETLSAPALQAWLREMGPFGMGSGLHHVVAGVHGGRPSERPSRRPNEMTPITEREPTAGSTRYAVRQPGGPVVATVSPAELIEQFATRRLSLHAEVQRNDGIWRAARSVPELAAIAAAEDFIDLQLASRQARHLSVDRSRLPALLYGISQRRDNCVLIACDGERRLAVSFTDGAVSVAISSDRDHLLGTRLVEDGLISRADLEEAFEQLVVGLTGTRSELGRLGDWLLAEGRVAPKDLLRILVEQLEARITGLLTWQSGDLWVVPRMQAPQVPLHTVHSLGALVSQGVRLGYSGLELTRLLAALGNGPLAASPAPPVAAEALGLTQGELEALHGAGGAKSLTEYLAVSATERAASPDDVLRAVFVGLSAGLLVSPGWAGSRAFPRS